MSDAIPSAEVRPDDQERWLGPPPWQYTPTLKAWEEAHGHDVRVKCYPEYGCRAIEVERDALLDENERLREAIHSHREYVQCDGSLGTDADDVLWAVLEER